MEQLLHTILVGCPTSTRRFYPSVIITLQTLESLLRWWNSKTSLKLGQTQPARQSASWKAVYLIWNVHNRGEINCQHRHQTQKWKPELFVIRRKSGWPVCESLQRSFIELDHPSKFEPDNMTSTVKPVVLAMNLSRIFNHFFLLPRKEPGCNDFTLTASAELCMNGAILRGKSTYSQSLYFSLPFCLFWQCDKETNKISEEMLTKPGMKELDSFCFDLLWNKYIQKMTYFWKLESQFMLQRKHISCGLTKTRRWMEME